ncbi:MAG: alanine racemase [Flavobacteriia bacterium]|nr:alanine racemase [Flavobacteriia bacterium]
MKLDYTYTEICEITKGELLAFQNGTNITSIVFDSRKIISAENVLFFALNGDFRNGHSFLQDAHQKGIRHFVVSENISKTLLPDSTIIQVENTLIALQQIASHHRQKFTYPIVAITGSVGKTMVKEWIYHFLASKFRIIRSPKSFNSQLGVALSLLELHEQADIALIEMGISKSDEMNRLEKIVSPDLGVFTAFGSAHQSNFLSHQVHLNEKLIAFKNCAKTIYHASIILTPTQLEFCNGKMIDETILENYIKIPFQDKISKHNVSLAIAFAKEFGLTDEEINQKIKTLPHLAMRMEVFEGINGNTIINDTYNLDIDALTYSLEYQLSISEKQNRVVIIGLDEEAQLRKNEIENLISPFKPEKTIYICGNDSVIAQIENSIILIKGSRKSNMQKIASQFRLKKHKTYLEIDLNAIRSNLAVFKSYLNPDTKILAMVKASSYGSGVERMAAFLEKQGVNYLGVAYADEGVELRKLGITTPILVMNAEEEGFEDCIQFNLEPAIYSFKQLDEFIKELIASGKSAYPIHLKIDTGMRRLGFEIYETEQIIEILQAQPEIRVESVYTHLAETDNFESREFTLKQIEQFNNVCEKLESHLMYKFNKHTLNSEGIANYSDYQLNMVRLGIGMYGYSSNPELKTKLQASIFWKSVVSQVKIVQKNESVGYNRTFKAEEHTQIAIIPVGYADGFKRCLSNGIGSVFIQNQPCKVLGRVCMDMLMVDVTNKNVSEGDEVEIIGLTKTMEEFANQSNTIPYEVMTSISKRVHRVYLEN